MKSIKNKLNNDNITEYNLISRFHFHTFLKQTTNKKGSILKRPLITEIMGPIKYESIKEI